ncbi:MAG: hypothetical protein RMJ83_09315, partial [Armatimonadota bacterium]|nr:hypothetical protein [Armatimonadota bacterium]
MRKIVIMVLLSLYACVFAQRVYQAQPTDDVWYYDQAFNPGFTAILRVWGNGQFAVDPTGARPSLNFSYSLAKWRLEGIPAGRQYQVLSAQITVVQTQPPGYSREEGEQFPLEARPISHTNFSEAYWNYNAPNNPEIGAEIFGTGRMTNHRFDAPFAIPIPLDVALFEPYFNAAVNQNNGELGIGFVSRIDPGGQGGQRFYRFYSRNDGGGRGPVLRVVYRVAGDITGDDCTNNADLL